ncbi:MAG: YlxR family protein [Actinomycetota bacterium]
MPVRMCIGCRRKTEKTELVRVVLQEGKPVANPKGNQPGRGAYLCPDVKCLGKAIESGSLARIFKIKSAEGIKGFDAITSKIA